MRRTSTPPRPPADADEIHRCVNPSCRKPMLHRRKNAKYCSPRCRSQVKAKEQEAREDEDEPWISQACRHPTQQQAELVRRDMGHRHPHKGRRIHRYSGYCVIRQCECKCHPWNEIKEDEAEAA